MQSVKTYPCNSCEYIGVNRRMLAQHVAVAHSKRVFRCPLCPFITQYAANWYRHKRHLHGVSKFTTCDICGFFANSPLDLTQHKEKEHPNSLPQENNANPLYQERPVPDFGDVYSFHLSPPHKTEENLPNNNNIQLPVFNSYENTPSNESVTFSLPITGKLLENDVTPTLPVPEVAKNINIPDTSTAMNTFTNSNALKPLKIRRSYCCDLCGFLTGSPREFLYHQKDAHNMRMNIFECELCIYASKHIQKLQRHYGLVHRQQKQFEIPTGVPEPKVMMISNNNEYHHAPPNFNFLPPNQPSTSVIVQKPTPQKREKPGLLKCTICTYHTRNKVLMAHHQKTVHFKKKVFKCDQCGYVTNEKARYTKHVKYHNLSKMQCEFCHFKSAYKWNMDRHIRNHMQGANGEYNCTICSFVTNSKQSLKYHATNHHEYETADYEDDDESHEMEPGSEIISDQSGEMVVDDGDWMNLDAEEFETVDSSSNIDNENMENSNITWEQQQNTPKVHRCSLCNFTTSWPFELKKHEDTHKSDKKHSCPICGMRFEHIAWLTKHLHRVHPENAEAQNLAAAYELIKPQRRRPANNSNQRANSLSPSKQSTSSMKRAVSPKQTLLSNYLKNPTMPRFNYSPPKEEMLRKALKQPEPQYEFSTPNITTVPKKKLLKRTNACSICDYKTKWASELDRHMRVHTENKPFHCHLCSYHSKWKGDLNRHITKYHGCKLPVANKTAPVANKTTPVPNKIAPVPKIRLKKAVRPKTSTPNDWETVSEDSLLQDKSQEFNSSKKDEESPLDLTISKTSIFQPSFSSTNGTAKGRRESFSDRNASNSSLNMLLTSNKSEPKSKNFPEVLDKEQPKAIGVKKKYFCPFCTFNTSTPSRFHVHIIQHYNRRPFMCSVCGHNSNWEWDITKHIRLKGCKDKEHNNACVLLTHESGRRNYEKYDKYLRETKSKAPCSSKISTKIKIQEDWQDHTNILKHALNTPTSRQDQPENIIVTPDLPFSQELVNKSSVPTLGSNEQNWNGENTDIPNESFKYFLCKHCNYKHSSKKVVISHLSAHAGVRPFRCRACGLTSSWRNVIVQHIKSTHNGYMNDVEDRITYAQEGFVIRITSVKNAKFTGTSSVNRKPTFNCKLCPYKCDKEVYIRFHMKQHKPKEGAIYQCQVCPYFVKFKRTLVRHVKLHNSPEAQNSNSSYLSAMEEPDMSLQDEASNSMSNYTYTYQQGESQENYMDDDENENSIRIAYDQLHSPEKTSEPSFSKPSSVKHKRPKLKKHLCENCPYRTDNQTAHLYHKQFHRPNPSAPFKCTVCTYWATMQHLLTQHMKVHQDNLEDSFEEEIAYPNPPKRPLFSEPETTKTPPQPGSVKMFKCRYCPMTNKKRANVKVHEKMHAEHANDGKVSCHLCTYKCAGQGNLTNHLKLHHSSAQGNDSTTFITDSTSGIKKKFFSYFCVRCPAVFKSSSDLFIHKTFHGSTLPFPCPHCDYRAKHRIHLQKHLQVHTDEYISKRDASCGPPLSHKRDEDELQNVHPRAKSVNSSDSNKKIDQMLLLELAEIKSFLRNSKIKGQLHKCQHCPASFSKLAILTYHVTLHGSSGEFGCSHCNYATIRPANLAAHSQVHGKVRSPVRRLSRVFSCPNCPAVFEKNNRFERHMNLHGKQNRFTCEYCDYSVNCAANLTKHKSVHEKAELAVASGSDDPDVDEMNGEVIPKEHVQTDLTVEEQQEQTQSGLPKSPEILDDRKAYACERCPYFQMRKDAVLNHQNRHYQKEGLHCPYCDYRVIGLSFLQNHIKSHITPTNVFAPQLYAKFNKFEISYKDDDTKIVLFDDKGSDFKLCDRFFPPLNNEDILNLSHADEIIVNNNQENITKGTNSDISSQSNNLNVTNLLSTTEVLPEYLPKVVLTDIFSSAEISTLFGKKPVKIRSKSEDKKSKSKLKTYSTVNTENENTSKNQKSSIIVKIKVENVVEDNNEKSLYSISNSNVDEPKFADNATPIKTTNKEAKKSTMNANETKFAGNTIPMKTTNKEIKKSTMNVNETKFADNTIPIKTTNKEVKKSTMGVSEPKFSNNSSPIQIINKEVTKTTMGMNEPKFSDNSSPIQTTNKEVKKSTMGVNYTEDVENNNNANISNISASKSALEHHDYEAKYPCDSDMMDASNESYQKDNDMMDVSNESHQKDSDMMEPSNKYHKDRDRIDVSDDSYKIFHEINGSQESINGIEETQSTDILKKLNSMVNGVCVDPVQV